MLPFRKIIFPVDYSEPCKAVIPYVRDIMRQYQAALTVVHAYGAEALPYSDVAITDIELPKDVRVLEEKRLKEFAAENFPGDSVQAMVRLGDASMVIHQLIRHEGTDLVMLATHGHGAVRRFLLGSVCAKVLHDVSTAVWTGRGPELTSHKPSVPYKSILCAVEIGDEAEAVAVAAAALAKSYGAELTLVTAVETPPSAMEIDFAPIKKEMVDAAHLSLRAIKAKLGLTCKHSVLEAGVAAGVREEAIRCHADLIVTGRGHSQDRLGRLWSNLYSIIRNAPCPVLSV